MGKRAEKVVRDVGVLRAQEPEGLSAAVIGGPAPSSGLVG
jgi:hypothetical protein